MLAIPPSSRQAEVEQRVGNVEIRPAELQVLIDGRRAGLTVREYALYFVLAQRLDRVVQRAEIYELVWGGKMPRRDRSVDVLVRKVRRKLELVAPAWSYIHPQFGIGYRYTPEPSRPAPAGSLE
jgi:DNA-binding response OmpR family regulator